MANALAWKYLVPFLLLQLVIAERIKDMIYVPLDGVAACFRRHNGTHQFGCSSSRTGSVGVVHLVESDADVKWLEQNATAGPYTVVMPFSMFTRPTLLRLRNTDDINGILLTRNISEERPFGYSPDDVCPNRYSGYEPCDEALPWNPLGSSLILEDWPFPMFYTKNQTLLKPIKSCFWTHNAHDLESQSGRSLCAIEMRSFMFAAINSEICIKRSDFKVYSNPMQFCDPLGDRNIHWPLAPLRKEGNSVIMVTARLDASSLFDGISPGAGNAVTGLVALLATAYSLNSLDAKVEKTNVVFSLLNGEAFDYIGSGRLVYDLKEGNFNALGGVNLKLDEIKCVIEFGQLGKGPLYLHTSNAKDDPLVENLKNATNATILENSVPPTSVQSFLRERSNLSTIVVSNHAKKFTNRYYNGILDDAESLDFSRNNTGPLATALTKVAIRVATELYQNITGSSAAEPPDEAAVEEIVSEMLICYLESANCKLFRAASSPGAKLVNQALPLYVGVHRVPNTATSLTGQLLAFLTGKRLWDMNKTTCQENHLSWMGGYNFTGLCINTTVNYSTAMSPAFIIEGYNMKSGLYSTWTESMWQTLSVRMFLKPSAATERFSLILGTLVAGLSFLVVWFVNSRADILFASRGPVEC